MDCADGQRNALKREQLDRLGAIVVKVCRYKFSPEREEKDSGIPDNSGNESDIVDEDEQKSKIGEESLKGSDLSHCVR